MFCYAFVCLFVFLICFFNRAVQDVYSLNNKARRFLVNWGNVLSCVCVFSFLTTSVRLMFCLFWFLLVWKGEFFISRNYQVNYNIMAKYLMRFYLF